MRRKRTKRVPFGICIVIVTIVVSGGVFTGCGKKADPRCPANIKPAAVSDLGVAIKENTVELSWTISGGKEDNSIFRIVRSELEIEGNDCPECPRHYSRLVEISFQDSKLIWRRRQSVAYRDSNVKAGHLYSYKVLLCGPSGTCSEESNRAEIKFP
ncbi:MAG: hypothetical protein JXC33_08515 [Deltaproteobacteria bacterium]|nr:hypothetical protein [Deltaproteobacteria bacterium]